jgi:hypothetical protein
MPTPPAPANRSRKGPRSDTASGCRDTRCDLVRGRARGTARREPLALSAPRVRHITLSPMGRGRVRGEGMSVRGSGSGPPRPDPPAIHSPLPACGAARTPRSPTGSARCRRSPTTNTTRAAPADPEHAEIREAWLGRALGPRYSSTVPRPCRLHASCARVESRLQRRRSGACSHAW